MKKAFLLDRRKLFTYYYYYLKLGSASLFLFEKILDMIVMYEHLFEGIGSGSF